MSFGKTTVHLKESVDMISFLKSPQMLAMCKQQYQVRRENKALVLFLFFLNKYTGILSSLHNT